MALSVQFMLSSNSLDSEDFYILGPYPHIGSTHLLFFSFCSVPFQFNSLERKLNRKGTGLDREWIGTGTGTEQEWNGNGSGLERKRNRNGTGMERNGNGTEMEQKFNGRTMEARFRAPCLYTIL